jgi:hypothetical protein
MEYTMKTLISAALIAAAFVSAPLVASANELGTTTAERHRNLENAANLFPVPAESAFVYSNTDDSSAPYSVSR